MKTFVIWFEYIEPTDHRYGRVYTRREQYESREKAEQSVMARNRYDSIMHGANAKQLWQVSILCEDVHA